MASAEQILKLRRRINDYYDANGSVLPSDDQTFTDDELSEVLDDAISEVTEGESDYSDVSDEDFSIAMLVARSDCLLMIAQDQARKTRWQVNNKVVHANQVSENLTKIAQELRRRYEGIMDRKLKAKIEGVSKSNTGGVLRFNTTTKTYSDYKFDSTNKNIKRNQPKW